MAGFRVNAAGQDSYSDHSNDKTILISVMMTRMMKNELVCYAAVESYVVVFAAKGGLLQCQGRVSVVLINHDLPNIPNKRKLYQGRLNRRL